ncbi:MAG: hypothetical protein FRX49_10803 [Trebouxia sp. A1-2]|nr:MAG: hypothetical protein FRX49_10803 [Trebouxia sp. A1-2]
MPAQVTDFVKPAWLGFCFDMLSNGDDDDDDDVCLCSTETTKKGGQGWKTGPLTLPRQRMGMGLDDGGCKMRQKLASIPEFCRQACEGIIRRKHAEQALKRLLRMDRALPDNLIIASKLPLCWVIHCDAAALGCYAEHSMCNMIASWTAAELKGIGLEIA